MRYKIPLKVRRFVTVTAPPADRLQFIPPQEKPYAEDEDGAPFSHEPCWLMPDSKLNNAGYGQIKMSGVTWNTHRLVYWIIARTPAGKDLPKIAKPGDARADEIILDHLCERRACCNPAHLDPISQSENVKRGARWR